jgi:hypothetical protein
MITLRFDPEKKKWQVIVGSEIVSEFHTFHEAWISIK